MIGCCVDRFWQKNFSCQHHLQVAGTRPAAFLVRLDRVFEAVACFDVAQAGFADRSNMNKHILAAVIGDNETKGSTVAEELDSADAEFSSSHVLVSIKKAAQKGGQVGR
jgi:hypothetical protein